MSASAGAAGTVIFDGDCGICTATARWIEAKDTRHSLTVIPYQLADLERLSPGLTPQMTAQSVYLVLSGGKRYKEARAVFEILKRLPGIWAGLGWLLANPLFGVLGAPFYRLVAINRTRLSVTFGMTACAVPSKPAGRLGERGQA